MMKAQKHIQGKFPHSQPDVLKQWIINIHRACFKPSKKSVVCSDHFTEECFDRTGQTVRLRLGAVPTIFTLPKNLIKTMDLKSRLIPETVETFSSEESNDNMVTTSCASYPNLIPTVVWATSKLQANPDMSTSLPSSGSKSRLVSAMAKRNNSRCCALDCLTKLINCAGIGYHRFPRDPKSRLLWQSIINHPNWHCSKYSRLCSLHFSSKDLVRKSGRTSLRATAIPLVSSRSEQNERLQELYQLLSRDGSPSQLHHQVDKNCTNKATKSAEQNVSSIDREADAGIVLSESQSVNLQVRENKTVKELLFGKRQLDNIASCCPTDSAVNPVRTNLEELYQACKRAMKDNEADVDIVLTNSQSVKLQVSDNKTVKEKLFRERPLNSITSCRPTDSAVTPVRTDLEELRQACKRAMNEVLALQEMALRIADLPSPPSDNKVTIENIRQDANTAHRTILHIESQVMSLQSPCQAMSRNAVTNSDTVDVGALLDIVCLNPSGTPPVANIQSVDQPAEPCRNRKKSWLRKMYAASQKIYGEHSYHLQSPATAMHKFEVLKNALESNTAKLKISQQKCRRLQARVASLTEKLKSQNSQKSDDATECIKASFSEPVQALLLRQLTKCKKHVKVEYPPELRMLALTLRYYSKPAYLFVRKMFNNKLPHPKTLAKWECCIDSTSGLEDENAMVFE